MNRNINQGGYLNGNFYPVSPYPNANPYMNNSGQYIPNPNPYAQQAIPTQQQMAQTQQQQMPTAQQQPSVTQTPNQVPVQFAFIDGTENAKSYILQPGQNACLLDENNLMIYYKKCDENGRSLYKCYSMTEVEMPGNSVIDPNKYVTKDDFNAFTAKIDNYINTFLAIPKEAKEAKEKKNKKEEVNE